MNKFGFGYIKICIPKEYRNLAMNAILINNLPLKKTKILPDLSLEITIRAVNVEKFKSTFADNTIKASYGAPYGALTHIAKYKRRWGAISGILFVVLAVYVSSLFLWRIDIEGNETVSTEEIIKLLESSGCSLGTYIPSINYDKIHNKFLLHSENISWISVNITGNVAKVLVKERLKEDEKPLKQYSNVVSKYDAQIASIHLKDGKKVISIGDVVRKGDLLISGVIDSKSQGVRYVDASGIVMGYVNKPIFIKIPFKSYKKVYTGNDFKEKTIKIFSKTINFSLKYSNSMEFCDKIEDTNKVVLFGIIELPIEVTTTLYREYEYQEVIYNCSEAIDMAFVNLREKMDASLIEAELISKSVNTYYDENYFYIDCNLYCLENISDTINFTVN